MASKPLNIMKIKREAVAACKADDVSAMSQIVSTAAELGSTTIKQRVLDFSINHAIKASASRVLSYILKENADVRSHPCNLNLELGHLRSTYAYNARHPHGPRLGYQQLRYPWDV